MKPAPPEIRDAVARQLKDVAHSAEAERKRKRHFRQAFEVLHVSIGLPAAVFAGAATVTALKDVSPNLIAALAGVATVLSAAQLFLRPADRAAYNRDLEAEFGRLANDAKRTCEIDLISQGEDEAAKKLESYQKRFAELQRRIPLGR